MARMNLLAVITTETVTSIALDRLRHACLV